MERPGSASVPGVKDSSNSLKARRIDRHVREMQQCVCECLIVGSTGWRGIDESTGTEDGNMSVIKSIAIAGFRSFGASVEVPRKPLNLLIGANGSGKSNILGAFAFLQA